MVSNSWSIVVVLLVSSCSCLVLFGQLASAGQICERTLQFWNSKLGKCVDCSQCPNGQLVITPCEIFRDTACKPIHEFYQSLPPRYRHKHNLHHHHESHSKHPDAIVHDDGIRMAKLQQAKERPFDSTETLVWDLQAIILTIAITACILFFIAVTLYSLHQARQWKRLKETFEADVEELSAKLSLMASVSDSDKDLEADILGKTDQQNDTTYNNRLVYLEQLLNVRKDDKLGNKQKGNVYIEESI